MSGIRFESDRGRMRVYVKRYVIRDLARVLGGDSEIEACDDDAAALKVENTAVPLMQIDPEAIKTVLPPLVQPMLYVSHFIAFMSPRCGDREMGLKMRSR
jgi:hypothetical protein